MAEQTIHFGRVCAWILAADAFARDVAGQFMQTQGDGQTLFASPLAVAFNLFFQCRRCIHAVSLTGLLQLGKTIQINSVLTTALIPAFSAGRRRNLRRAFANRTRLVAERLAS